MARILTIGDLHFQARKLSFGLRVGQAIMNHVQSVPQNYYQAIVVLGDTLHFFGRLECEAQVTAVKLFLDLAKYAPVHVLIGNHDRPSKNDFLTNFHPFTGLEEHPRIHIYPRPGWFTIGEYKFVAVPYVPIGRLSEALQYLNPIWNPADVTAVFTHQDYRGGKGDNGQPLTRGDVWPEDWPVAINGHLHEYQLIQHNLICPGAPAQHKHVGEKQRSISAFHFAPPAQLEGCNGFHGNNWREHRIFLDLPYLEEVCLNGGEVLRWQIPNDQNYYKLKIHGNKWEMKSLHAHPYVHKLESNARINLFWIPTDEIKLCTGAVPTEENISTDFYTTLLTLLTPDEQNLIQTLITTD